MNLDSYNIQTYVVIFFCVSLPVWYVQFTWKRRKLYRLASEVKGPLSLPFIGSAHMFVGNGNDIIKNLLRIQEDIPGLSKLWLGPKLFYLVSKPEHIATILNSSKALDKDDLVRFVAEELGHGLLTSYGKKWKHHRKIIAPAFQKNILDTFIEVFSGQSIIFADILKKYVGLSNMNLHTLTTNCTLSIMCQTEMGVEIDFQYDGSDLGAKIDRILEIINYRLFHIWFHCGLIWKLSPLSRHFHNLSKEILDMVSGVYQKKMVEYNRRNSSVDADIDNEPGKKMTAFLDLMLVNPVFTEEELIDEARILLLAGTDTTASTFCSLCSMLGMHQDVQQKVYEEAMNVLGPDRAVIPDDVSELNYTERVIKETLRLFPITAFISRTIADDIDLGDGITLPAGSTAAVGALYTHRDPNIWPDPLRFDPDRFLLEEVSRRHPCTYIPFSYGPRNCIGSRYAMMNLKTTIAIIIRRYKIYTEYTSVDEIELTMNLLLRMRDGPKIRLENRY